MNLTLINEMLNQYDRIIEALSVFAMFLAIVVSLKIARQSIVTSLKVDLRAKPSEIQIMYPSNIERIPSIPGSLELNVYNVGFSNAYFRKSGLRWCLPFPSSFTLPVYVRDTSTMGDPCCIQPGASLVCKLTDTVDWEVLRMFNDQKFNHAKRFGWHRFLYLELTTDSLTVFKVKLPNELKGVILWASKEKGATN